MIFNDEFLKEHDVLDWGYTESDKPISYEKFLNWTNNKENQSLKYLIDERRVARSSLKNIFPEFKSSFVFLFSYVNVKKKSTEKGIAGYVRGFDGQDYHDILKEKMKLIGDFLIKNNFVSKYQVAIDTYPILERDFAYQAGLGWFGKNSMLISRQHGSYFLIASLLVDKKIDKKYLEEKAEVVLSNDFCGTCNACVTACPTQAIDENNRSLELNKCISTFTIEYFKDEVKPPLGYEKSDYYFGCDICQDVCPWNKKKLESIIDVKVVGETKLDHFFKRNLKEIYADLNLMSNRSFRKFFKGTPLERTGRIGIMKNLKPYLNDD